MVSGAARVAGVIGWPVAHSRSPMLHGHWLARYGIDGAYVPLAVAPHALPDAVRGLYVAGFCGLNVTLPHKVAVMPLCTHVDDAARRIGAVNTLVFGPDGILGRNTDGIGFVASLEAELGALPPGPALLLGVAVPPEPSLPHCWTAASRSRSATALPTARPSSQPRCPASRPCHGTSGPEPCPAPGCW